MLSQQHLPSAPPLPVLGYGVLRLGVHANPPLPSFLVLSAQSYVNLRRQDNLDCLLFLESSTRIKLNKPECLHVQDTYHVSELTETGDTGNLAESLKECSPTCEVENVGQDKTACVQLTA